MDTGTAIAFAGLIVTVVMALLGFSFQMGKLSQRVTGLEQVRADEKEVFEKVIRLEAGQAAHTEGLSRVDQSLDNLVRQMGNMATALLQYQAGREKP
jgi:hypothetical protein